MNQTSLQTLADWSAKIETELVQLQVDLPGAVEELRKAQAAARNAEAAYRDLCEIVPVLKRRIRGEISGVIQGRLADAQQLVVPARGRVAIATAALKVLRERITERTIALRQLELVSPATETETAA